MDNNVSILPNLSEPVYKYMVFFNNVCVREAICQVYESQSLDELHKTKHTCKVWVYDPDELEWDMMFGTWNPDLQAYEYRDNR